MTAETTEIAFALGVGDRVAGVSGYAVRPPEARRKPKVAAFRTAHVDRILALRPGLVLGFSDLQADLAAALIRGGANVLITNQRTLPETYAAIRLIGGALGREREAETLAAGLERDLAAVGEAGAALPRRPRVWFEEWDEPLIAGIAWVSEIVALAGGEDIFPEARGAGGASGRVVDPAEVARRAPEVIVGSWCGKRFVPARVRARAGWDTVPAVVAGELHEIKAPDILQPGPSLARGARQLHAILARYTASD
jgi:iron complex transport system substrate-binding protein